jgi:hypothetical protein
MNDFEFSDEVEDEEIEESYRYDGDEIEKVVGAAADYREQEREDEDSFPARSSENGAYDRLSETNSVRYTRPSAKNRGTLSDQIVTEPRRPFDNSRSERFNYNSEFQEIDYDD